MSVILFAIAQLIHTVITLYIWIVIISALLSFVQPNPHNQLVQIIYRLTEPVYSWVRAKFPFMVFSGVDLSPLAIILALQFIDTILMRILL